MSDEERKTPEREYRREERERSRSPSRERERDRSRSPEREDDRKDQDEGKNEGTTLYVSSVPHSLKPEELEAHFSKAGKVLGARVVTDPHTGDSRGFAFVEMESVECAQTAMDMFHRTNLGGREIGVEKAKRSRPYKSTPGKYLGPPSANRDRNRYGNDRRGPPPSRYDRSYDRGYDRADRSYSRPDYYNPYDRPTYEDGGVMGSTPDHRPARGYYDRDRYDPYSRDRDYNRDDRGPPSYGYYR